MAIGLVADAVVAAAREFVQAGADRIVLLDAGTVRGDGSHEELLAAAGVDARLFTRQARRYVEDPGASHD